MAESFYFSNKDKNKSYKYIFVLVLAVITWVFQLSIFSRILYFDSTANLLLLGSIFCGLTLGPLPGITFGLISSFLCTSLLYDHVFYFSFPLIGLVSGIITKKIFSDELIFFLILSFLFTYPLELINAIQYNKQHLINIFDRLYYVGFNASVLNILLAPLFYWTCKFMIVKCGIKI